MNRLRSIKWYWWAALALPGGALLIAWRAKAKAAPSPVKDVGTTPASYVATTASAALEYAISKAKDTANSLRAMLGNDPLAATLLGVSPSLVDPSADPAAIASKAAQRDALLAKIKGLQDVIANANLRWGTDHFGGLSVDQFNSYIASQNAQIASLQTQIAALG